MQSVPKTAWQGVTVSLRKESYLFRWRSVLPLTPLAEVLATLFERACGVPMKASV